MTEATFDTAGTVKDLFRTASFVGSSAYIIPYTVEAFDLSGEDYTHLKVVTVDKNHICILLQSTLAYPANIHEWGTETTDEEGTWEDAGELIVADPQEIEQAIHKRADSVTLTLSNPLITIENGRVKTTTRSLPIETLPKDLSMIPDVTHFLDRKILIEGLERITAFGADRFTVQWSKPALNPTLKDKITLHTASSAFTDGGTDISRTFRLEHRYSSRLKDEKEHESMETSPLFSTNKIRLLSRILSATKGDLIALSYCENGPLFVEYSKAILPDSPMRQEGCSWRFLLAPMVKEEQA